MGRDSAAAADRCAPARVGRRRPDALDYPRHLKVDSVDSAAPSGRCSMTAWSIDTWNRWRSTTSIRQSPSIWRQTTRACCDRETGQGGNWWSIHELKMWAPQEKRSIHAPRHPARVPDVRRRGTPGNLSAGASPRGTIAGGLADPIILTTVLAWDADRLLHGLHGLWDPPFLYPRHWTLAYSEHMLGVAIFTAPIQWMFGNAVLTYNVAYIGSYVLAGFGMFLLTRALWGRADAAVLAGLAFALTPYRLAQSDHLQILMNGWMPIGLLGLHRYFASGSRRWLLVFAAAYLLTGLSNGYACISSCSRSAWWSAWSSCGRGCRGGASSATSQSPVWGSRRCWRRLSSCTSGFSRRCASRAIQDLLAGYSAGLSDYFRVAGGAWNWGGLLPGGHVERHLFHGFAVMIFAVVGVCTVGAHDRDEGSVGSRRRTVITYGSDRRARGMALDGARTLAAVRVALPLRSRFQRDAGPRAAGVHRHPRARRARGRGVRLAVRSLVCADGPRSRR